MILYLLVNAIIPRKDLKRIVLILLLYFPVNAIISRHKVADTRDIVLIFDNGSQRNKNYC